MSDDLTQSLQPVIVPASIDDFGFRISSTRESIDNSNQAPTSITLDASSAIENDVGGHIANINGVDPDGNSLTYSVISDPGGMIEVDGSTVKFREGVSADYEQYQSLHFSLRATDPDGLYKDQDFNLNVLDDTSDNNHAPTSITLDASSVVENDVGGHIANISGIDPDGDTLTYSVIVTNQESMMVEVTGTTIHFKDEWSADYEQDQSLDFILRATDPGGMYKDQAFSLSVLDDVSDNSPANQNTNNTSYNISHSSNIVDSLKAINLNDGSHLVVWNSEDNGFLNIFGQRFDNNGQKLGQKIQIDSGSSDNTGHAFKEIEIVGNQNDTFTVVYKLNSSTLIGKNFSNDGQFINEAVITENLWTPF